MHAGAILIEGADKKKKKIIQIISRYKESRKTDKNDFLEKNVGYLHSERKNVLDYFKSNVSKKTNKIKK